MSMIKYAYERGGAPILDWSKYPPQQSKAADAKALGYLGSLSGSSIGDGRALPLPVPGGPEPMGGDCSCSGTCGCTGLGDFSTPIASLIEGLPLLGPIMTEPDMAAIPPGVASAAVPPKLTLAGYAALGVGAYLLFRKLRKKK